MGDTVPKIRDTYDVPRNGWRFIDPDTGAELTDILFTELVRKVYSHRRGAGLSVEGLEDKIAIQLCSEMGHKWCECPEGFTVVENKTRGLTADMIVSATSAALSFMAEGFQWISAEEWEQRAKVCRNCRFNKPQNTCSCAKAYEIIEKTLPKEKRDPLLGVCAACGCTLQVKTWLPNKVIKAANANLAGANGSNNFPPWCWQINPS